MILQLNPPLPLETPKGKGWAHFLIDYSQEHDLLWVVFLNGSRECWTFSNPHIKIDKNVSLNRNGNPTDNSDSGFSNLCGKLSSSAPDRDTSQKGREEEKGVSYRVPKKGTRGND